MATALQDDLIASAPAVYTRLDPREQSRFLAHAEHLIRGPVWEGARGVELTDEMVLTIASHAALLGAGFETKSRPFRNVAAIVLHDKTIVTTGETPGPVRGVYTSQPQRLSGQSGHGHGPILLDWRTVRLNVAASERGSNVVYHEFAHKFDQLNGPADGMPPLPDKNSRAEWIQTLGTNFRRLRRRGSDGLVRSYGATNPAEYFAVTSEVFFTRPVELRKRLPRVYRRLADFYNQDPAARS